MRNFFGEYILQYIVVKYVLIHVIINKRTSVGTNFCLNRNLPKYI